MYARVRYSLKSNSEEFRGKIRHLLRMEQKRMPFVQPVSVSLPEVKLFLDSAF